MKNLSLITWLVIGYLILIHFVFLALIPLFCTMSLAGIVFFDLGPKGVREWGMLITSSLFPVVAIAVIISAWFFYWHKSYKKAVWINLIPLINFIGFYAFLSWDPLALERPDTDVQLTAQEAYRTYLNLELPKTISHFKGKDQTSFPIYPRYVRFTYQATPAYFDTLRNHQEFIRQNEFNTPIHEVDCTFFQDAFQDTFFSWQEKPNKICFIGVFFPYVHFLVYDKITSQVDHLVDAPD